MQTDSICVMDYRPSTNEMEQVNQLLLFPGRLLKARERCSTSQKAVALTVGIDQAFFCGVEKGRRPPFTDRVLGQLSSLLQLNQGDAEALACPRNIRSRSRPLSTVAVGYMAGVDRYRPNGTR